MRFLPSVLTGIFEFVLGVPPKRIFNDLPSVNYELEPLWRNLKSANQCTCERLLGALHLERGIVYLFFFFLHAKFLFQVACFVDYAVFTVWVVTVGLAFNYYCVIHAFSPQFVYYTGFACMCFRYETAYSTNASISDPAPIPMSRMLVKPIKFFSPPPQMWTKYTISVFLGTSFFKVYLFSIFPRHSFLITNMWRT